MLTAAVSMLVFGAVASADTIYFAWEIQDPISQLWMNTPTFVGDPQQEGKPEYTKIDLLPGEADLLNYRIWVAIDDEGDGASSQGLAGHSFDIATNTGLLQPLPIQAKTKTTGPTDITAANWVFVGYPTYVTKLSGFGFDGGSFNGNATSNVGSILGPGAAMNPGAWVSDVDTFYTAGLQPKQLHNVGYGAPPGLDVGGSATPPPAKARDKWYLLEGSINIAGLGLGSYYVDLQPGIINVIRPDVDLNFDITDGYQIGASTIGDTILGHMWWFNIVPEPATLSVLLFAGVGLVIRRRR
jgi:hypothetical protein